ncbi:MAG: alpha/beta fold hydrolase [Paracoccaceae bacterium]|nr:alpha/beta fold hydrolase [Paracoccaceae bacterium]
MEGATIVLLHGLFDDAKGWRDLPRKLTSRGARVVALDLPGHGGNADGANSFDTLVERIAELLPAGRLHLVGHSLGAATAARLAVRLGPRVVGLTLCAPAGIGAAINADFAAGMLTAETLDALAAPLALLDAGPVSTSGLAQELDRLRATRLRVAALAHSIAPAGHQAVDVTSDLARIACPATVIFGTADQILDWRDVANLPPDVAIHLVRGAGHMPHHAAPELFLRLVLGDPPPAWRIMAT